jgi:hypothetical protein
VCVRRNAVPADGAAIDRARLPLPRLPEDDRQCIRAQYVDREELRRSRSQRAEIIHAAGGERQAPRGIFLRELRDPPLEQVPRRPRRYIARAGRDPGSSGKDQPDVHIFTRSKLPWFELPPDKPAFEAFYKISEVWPAASQERLRRNIAGQS